MVLDVNPGRQKLALSIRASNTKIQQDEMVKYIHDDSSEEKATLAELLNDKSKT